MRFSFSGSRSSSELSTILAHRYESVFCLFIIILAFVFRDNPYLVCPQIFYLLSFLLALNLAVGSVLRIPRFGRGLAVVIILANCATIAAILSYSGEQASNLWVLFLLPIYTACLFLEGWPIIWITSGAVACNVIYYFFSTPQWDSVAYFELLTKSAVLVFVAVTTWTVALLERSSQRTLERAENYMYLFRKLLGQMDDAILVVNPGTGHMVDINGTWGRRLGYEKDEFKGISLADLPGFLPPEVSWKDFVAQIQERKLLRFECQPQRKDQSYCPAEVHIQWVAEEDRNYLIAVARDITERKQSEYELRLAQEQIARSEKLAAIGRLASGVGHELRNPLTAIKNAIYVFKEVVVKQHLAEKDQSVGEVLQHAEKEINIATNIISDLLDFSRVVRINPQMTDINALVAEAKRDFEIRDGVRVLESYTSDLPQIRVDPQKFHQVIVNLANNAIQSMPSGGELEISTRLNGAIDNPNSQVLIAFKDTGAGISPEDMSRLFEPLFTTKASGTGLGLTVSLGIVHAHNGDIKVESESGHGSVFTIILPLGEVNVGQR